MVIYIETDGNVKILSPENLYQGSTTNRITLLTPFPSTTAVSIGFILPDGSIVTDENNAHYFPMNLLDTETKNGITSTAYDFALPFTVLEQYGDLKIAFVATFVDVEQPEGKVTAFVGQTSYLATVEVQESILGELPTEPTPDIYNLLRAYIQEASDKAIEALNTAESAQTAAENATNTANTAKSNSETAISTANAAKSAADTAESNSEQAVTTANNAAATASAAVQTAGAANATANKANTTAQQAKDEAESANTYAQGAVSAANTANTIATEAKETANEAEDIARGIDGKATEALSNSQTAVSTANEASATATEAKTTADGIDGKATEALSNSEQAIETADEAKALAEQAVAGAGTEVYVNNALQAKLNFTSDPQTQITANKNAIAEAQSDISDIVSGAQTVGKATNATQDADGNVIDTTYAKLSQVVRVDVAQSLTDEEKTRAKDNLVIQTTKIHSPSTTKGWYRVAKLNSQSAYSVAIGQAYNYTSPTNLKLALNLGYQNAIITQESGILSSSLSIDCVRVCVGTTTDAFFDVHIHSARFNTTKISIDRLYDSYGAVAIETYTDWEYLGTDDTVTGYTVTLLDLVSGTNTSGQVYQQGSPVLVGDQSAIFESDGVTVKEASKLATPRALPVNLALPSSNANKFDGSKDASLGVTGTLPVANGGTGATDLSNVTVGRATADGNGNNIPNTYATKALGTYTAAGLAKIASTTNGGNITSGNSDDTVPTIKNICDWVRNNFLPSAEPDWKTGTSGSLTLPSSGWYIFSAVIDTNLNRFSGLVYASVYTSYQSFPVTGQSAGVLTPATFNVTSGKLSYGYGDGKPSTSVAYWKLA